MREIFVSELVKEVLGPRNGLREEMKQGPLGEYVTGVLAPLDTTVARDADADSEIPFSDSQNYDEEVGEVDVDVPPLLSPALHPKNRPSSIGLSFAVEGSVDTIEVCLTWSKYERGSKSGNWVRNPRLFLKDISTIRDDVFWIGPDGNLATAETAEISLNLLVRSGSRGSRLVSLFLVNRVKFFPKKQEDRPRTEHHIFQPQIRIAAEPNPRIVPWTEGTTVNDEDRELNMLYKGRPLLARGHLCSAIWKDIDPEKPFEGTLDFPESKRSPPFNWIDGELLPESKKSSFSPAAVRTEFVPVYSIPGPDLKWPHTARSKLPLQAFALAETWDPSELRELLQPIPEEYRDWIKSKNRELHQRTDLEKASASKLISVAEGVLDRINRGIDILCSNEDCRLSFCFANKALDTQWRWSRGSGLEWRPFQMAFILMTLESIVDQKSPDREICDLLWVPTGGGKTEAYLAIAALAFAFRRRRALKQKSQNPGAGVCVITRYTLRLLTIQQFRRALGVVTAAELLRVQGIKTGTVGWRPNKFNTSENYLWGSTPFNIGLWVGGAVTPNKLQDGWGGTKPIPGALSILQKTGRISEGEGEPAQVLVCPACSTILSIPSTGLAGGNYLIHLVVTSTNLSPTENMLQSISGKYGDFKVKATGVHRHNSASYYTLSLDISSNKHVWQDEIDNLWIGIKAKLQNVQLVSTRASRPGYFYRWFSAPRGKQENYDFEIFCTNPACPLHTSWIGGKPSGSIIDTFKTMPKPQHFPDGNKPIEIIPQFRDGTTFTSDRIPIPALTVDDQLYRHVPTIIIATVDKFARPPFEPRAAAFFGNVGHHHSIWGYNRAPPQGAAANPGDHPKGPPNEPDTSTIAVSDFVPPELILQDELHLIEGPLGSLVGIYETAIDYLCQERTGVKLKYLASTATVRRAAEQVRAVFSRRLQIFPPHVLSADDRFFVRDRTDSEIHALDDSDPGRLYVGIAAPGRGPLTPVVRIWARLMQTAWLRKDHPGVDSFWTVTGYFNAIRELAGVRALYRQDIPERLRDVSDGDPRPTPPDRCQELSSVTDSVELPAVLDLLGKKYPEAQDSVLTTSMFGTGVDVPRIGLMVVHGQPKTTSSYIQSTGRVGRSQGGLVVTFLRATRPRDLNHYEFFSGYHRQLHRFVEPITVYPYAPGVLDRALGPVAVFMLRNKSKYRIAWCDTNSAHHMATNRPLAPEITEVATILDDRGALQPGSQATGPGEVRKRLDSKLDLWQNIARRRGVNLRYVEYAIASIPKFPVVLGDAQHVHFNLDVVYENVPQSLRDIEETLGFET